MASDGSYITINWTKNDEVYGKGGWIDKVDPSKWYFTYGKRGKFKEGTPWASVAISENETQLGMGDTVKIGLYPDKTFEVTDTGTFRDTEHLDVFIGADTYANAIGYGTKIDIPVWKVIGQ